MGFPRQKYWSGSSCPPPGDLSHPEIKPMSHVSCSCLLHWQAGSLPLLMEKDKRNKRSGAPKKICVEAARQLFSMFEHRRGKSFYYKLDLEHREGIFSHHDALAGLGAGASSSKAVGPRLQAAKRGWAPRAGSWPAHIPLPRWLQEAPAGNDPQVNLNKPGVEGGHAQILTETWQSQVGALGPGNSDPGIYTTKGHAPTWLAAVSLEL